MEMFCYLFILYLQLFATTAFQCIDKSTSQLNFYPLVSTKTGYDRVHGEIKRLKPNCKPVQMWVIMRHGTRYAGKPEIPKFLELQTFRDDILRNHKEGRGCLAADKKRSLQNWKPNKFLHEKHASGITLLGKEEVRQVGKRLRTTFPELIIQNSKKIKPDDYIFRAAVTQRTNETLKALAEGLFAKAGIIEPSTSSASRNILEVFRECGAWNNDYQSKHFNDERDSFVKTDVFKNFLIDFSNRLGFTDLLTFDQLYLIYGMCRYEMAWIPNKPSTWCMLFNNDEMELLEYSEDLSYYYNSGPGRDISKKFGCFALHDMIEHFKKVENLGANQPKGIFYFGHTVSVQTFMMALGVNTLEKPLKAAGHKYAKTRQFRTSIQSPFSTNVVAVLYNCAGEAKPYKVMFHLCEKPLYIPHCKGEVCDWQDFKAKFESGASNCNLEFCDNYS